MNPTAPRSPDTFLRGPSALAAAGVLLAAVALSGCYTPQVDAKRTVVVDRLKLADLSGTIKCAPQQYAIAKANYEFSDIELQQGDSQRAWEHIALAETAINQALKDSGGCAPDTDKDGTPDFEDKCPTVPGPKENAGCPWPDTDKDGVNDHDDKCPTVPGPKENAGCPFPDSDGDGIPDNVDKCPHDPEDFDGFEDTDGCPEPDNDKDGVPDVADRCPQDPGPLSNQGCPVGDRDGDGVKDDVDACPDVPGLPEFKGCPPVDSDGDGVPDFIDKCPNEPGPISEQGCPKKYSLVVLRKNKIEIKEQVRFDTNKYVILKASFELMNQVAQVLKDNPKIKVRIDGHTDSKADDNFNLKLSQKRAEACRTYLIKAGIAADRLSAKGWGETVPIASNRTEEGRKQNRRVEFNIVDPSQPNPTP
jgi:outer membrane protein OmpA-like peptidoglycan-associated protein